MPVRLYIATIYSLYLLIPGIFHLASIRYYWIGFHLHVTYDNVYTRLTSKPLLKLIPDTVFIVR